MKYFFAIILVFVTTAIFSQGKAPVQIRRFETNGPGARHMPAGEPLSIPELAALISEDSGRIIVEHIMEPQMRPKGYEKTDLQEDDVILMANGGKLASLAALKAIYDTATIGSTVKFGVRRKEEMMIASFVKADPKNLPKLRMIVSHGDDEEMFGIPQAGLILTSKGKSIVVKEVLEHASSEVHGEVQAGDLVLKLNGSAVRSLKDLRTSYEKLPVGGKIQLLTSHSGKNREIEFTKPKDEGKMIIRRQGNR